MTAKLTLQRITESTDDTHERILLACALIRRELRAIRREVDVARREIGERDEEQR